MKLTRKQGEFITVFLIILTAFGIRFFLSTLNFFQDEVYTALAVRGIIEHGIPEMPSGLLYLRAFPFSYLSSIGVLLFGFDEWALRFFPILLSLISIAVLYRILKQLTDSRIALGIATVLALSPWHIMYSLFARSFLLQSLGFVLILYCYYQYLKTKKITYLYWNAVWIALEACLSPTLILIGPTILFVLFIGKKNELTSKSLFVFFLHILLVISALFLPSVVYPWQKDTTGNLYALYEIRSFILPNSYFWSEMIRWFPVGLVLIGIGSYQMLRREKQLLIFPFFIFSSFFILSVVNPFENLQPRYLANFMLPYFVALALSIWYLTQFTFSKIKSKTIMIILLLLLGSDLYLLPHFISFTYGSRTPQTMQISRSWDVFHDIESNVDYVDAHAKNEDVIISLQPKGQTEAYLDTKELDYFLRTKNYREEGHLQGAQFVDDYSNTPIITSAKELEKIIESDAKIWIITSKSLDPTLNHIDSKTYDVLIKNAKLVYQGREPYSKVYVIY